MIVSFSGIDGSGKTTQINKLADYCECNGIKYLKRWSKARGTPGIIFLKRLVRSDKKMNLEQKLKYREAVYNSGWKKKALFVASMIDLGLYWGISLRFMKLKYDMLILDRYIWDTYVEVSNEFCISNLSDLFLWKIVLSCAVKPNVSILLVIPPEESLRRDLLKGEIATDALKMKISKTNMYMSLKSSGCWNTCLDSLKNIEITHAEVLAALNFKK